ncbi:MAG: putative hydrolase of the HAD superfamily [Salibacteraceae bacterium]|jgi:putative hydrolase of the HAD superfamily
MLLDIPRSRIELLQKLSEKYRIFLLSNTNSIHIDAAIRTWNKVSDTPMGSVFETIYFSHRVGMRKPNLEIFDYVCEQHKLNKQETLFIDDSIQHIEGAKKSGLHTLHLTGGLNIQDVFS